MQVHLSDAPGKRNCYREQSKGLCVSKAVDLAERKCDVVRGIPRARQRTSTETRTEPRPPTQMANNLNSDDTKGWQG